MMLKTTALQISMLVLIAALVCCTSCNSENNKSTATKPNATKPTADLPTINQQKNATHSSTDPQQANKDITKPTKSNADSNNSVTNTKIDEKAIQQTLQSISVLAEQGRFDEALRIVQNALIQAPNDARLLFMYARILAAKNQLDLAVQVADSIKPNTEDITIAQLGQTSEWLIAQGKLSDAEKRLKQLLERLPGNPTACQMLIRIYTAQGRRLESVPLIKQYIQAGSFQLSDLAMLCNIENLYTEDELFGLMREVPAEKDHALVYQARLRLFTHQWQPASDLLTEALSINARNLEAWVWYGYVQASIENWDAMNQWLASKPNGFDKHPQFWIVMGMWFESIGRKEDAVQSYANALKIDPRSPTATSRIGNCLLDLGQTELAESFRKRTYLITKSNASVRDVLANLRSEDCKSVSQQYNRLGDTFLADAWAKVAYFFEKQPAHSAPSTSEKSEGSTQKVTTQNNNQGEPTESVLLPPLLYQIASLNLPEIEFANLTPTQVKVDSPSQAIQTNLAFADVTGQRGLSSAEFDWGKTEDEAGVYVYRGLGGGVAVFDFDCNGYPDLCFSRAGANISEPTKNKPKQVFRNIDGNFVEVPPNQFGFEDRGYGQGVACGDFNQDGFTDLLVANIGSLNLYSNNGDGTFSLTYSHPLTKKNRWVTACVLADINRDSLPDIVAATYFQDADYETRQCPREKSKTYACPPQLYLGCKDIVITNLGTNQWQDESDSILTGDIDLGRTLGVVVGDFDQRPGNEIYLSNDTTANHYYSNRLAKGRVELVQNAGAAGVAVDANGRPQGSMGIAVCDLDRNGLEDIYVTNAMGEYNTLYLQKKPNLFIESSRTWNLYQSDLRMVGFGCVFSDVDSDGWNDLFVLNGNLDDYRSLGEAYKMLPQFYHNNGTRMNLVPPEQLEGYFQQPTLGRGLATIDFDVDHKQDFVATHCDQPASLIQNITLHKNHFVEFELTGRQCDRDAVGARVHIDCKDETWTAGIQAGESYYSSCEKILHIGLGNKDSIDRVRIDWSDGTQQTIENLASDRRYLVVQGLSPIAR